eukprot:3911211-Amphidinium_carterae.3
MSWLVRARLGGNGRVSCGGRACSLQSFHQGSETVAMAAVPPCGMMPTEGSRTRFGAQPSVTYGKTCACLAVVPL